MIISADDMKLVKLVCFVLFTSICI